LKLILAILRDKSEDRVTKALTSGGFRVTAIASSGGFLKQGMTTLIVGVEDAQLENALSTLRGACTGLESGKKCAKIFVMKIEDSIHF
jgi:uncharacterized protein YaaQ